MFTKVIKRLVTPRVWLPWQPISRNALSGFGSMKQGCLLRSGHEHTSTCFYSQKSEMEKTAVVTGSTSGLGLAIAKALAMRGTNVIVTGLGDQATIHAITEDINGLGARADYVACDLRDKKAVGRFCDEVLTLYPSGIDILVNNAGLQYVSAVTEFPDEKWDEMIAIMLTAPFILTKRFAPAMKNKGWGRIINMSSMNGHVSVPGKAVYSTTKTGIIGFTRGVALDLALHGVTCNAVCPTYALTPLVTQQIEALAKRKNLQFEDATTEFLSGFPIPKAVSTEQVAELVEFLIYSDASTMMTGASYLMDGGHVAQ